MRGETCWSNKSSFLWLLHISLSLALIICVPFDPLLQVSARWDVYLCCAFSCLCENICTPSGGNKVDLYVSSCPIYLMQHDIYDILSTVTSGPSYHLFTMCTLFWISPNGRLNCDLTAEESIQEILFFCLSVFLELTSSLHCHHCRCPEGIPSHLNVTYFLMWVDGEQLFLFSSPSNDSFHK